jgi:hypothetical protein
MEERELHGAITLRCISGKHIFLGWVIFGTDIEAYAMSSIYTSHAEYSDCVTSELALTYLYFRKTELKRKFLRSENTE